jgi:hypothetical protein
VELNRITTGTLSNSNIGSNVLQIGLYSQVKSRVENLNLEKTVADLYDAKVPTGELLSYLFDYPGTTLICYLRNLKSNIQDVFYFAPQNPLERTLRRRWNDVTLWIHVLMFFPAMIFVKRKWRSQDEQEFRIVTLAALFYLAFLPTGIAIWASDRFMAPLITTWPILFFLVWQAKRGQSQHLSG